MRIQRIIALFAILFFPLSASAADTKTVAIGQQFSMELESNPTTGFEWKLAQPLDENVLRLIGNSFAPKDNPRQLVGVGGKEVWTFEAVGQGSAEVSLEYARPWEKGIQPVRMETFQVNVTR